MEGRVIMPLGHKTQNQNDNGVSEMLSLRLPIFNQNKPYLFLKISKNTDKYRLSLSPDFLKQYNISFRIFRNNSLDTLIASLSETSRLNTNFNKLDFRLPKKESQEVIKLNYIMDINDDNQDIINIEKYTFMGREDREAREAKEETIIFVTERNCIIDNEAVTNICLTFVSKRFKTLEEFLKDLDNR